MSWPTTSEVKTDNVTSDSNDQICDTEQISDKENVRDDENIDDNLK